MGISSAIAILLAPKINRRLDLLRSVSTFDSTNTLNLLWVYGIYLLGINFYKHCSMKVNVNSDRYEYKNTYLEFTGPIRMKP